MAAVASKKKQNTAKGEKDEKNEVIVRLILSSLPDEKPEDKPLDIGLQDKKQQVHPGAAQGRGGRRFECRLEVKRDGKNGGPIFTGSFAQGTPADRFLYISWKRRGGGAHPWLRRVKVPLGGLRWADVSAAITKGKVLEADVTGRRPHGTEPVDWVLGKA